MIEEFYKILFEKYVLKEEDKNKTLELIKAIFDNIDSNFTRLKFSLNLLELANFINVNYWKIYLDLKEFKNA